MLLQLVVGLLTTPKQKKNIMQRSIVNLCPPLTTDYLLSSQCSGSRDTRTTHLNLRNTVVPDQYTYFTAKEAFHYVKGSINIQKLQHCKENQSASLTPTGVKNYQILYRNSLQKITFLSQYSVQNQMHFQQEECVFF